MPAQKATEGVPSSRPQATGFPWGKLSAKLTDEGQQAETLEKANRAARFPSSGAARHLPPGEGNSPLSLRDIPHSRGGHWGQCFGWGFRKYPGRQDCWRPGFGSRKAIPGQGKPLFLGGIGREAGVRHAAHQGLIEGRGGAHVESGIVLALIVYFHQLAGAVADQAAEIHTGELVDDGAHGIIIRGGEIQLEIPADLILVAGDWVRFDYRGRDKRAILDAVRALTKIAPVFGNFGNHEALADHREAMAEELKAEGARILVDESLIFKRTGKDGEVSSIRLTGLDTPFDYYHGHSAAKCREAFIALAGAMRGAVRQVIGSYSLDTNAWDSEAPVPEKALFSIAIAHRPELLKVYAKLGFDLVLCGHAHGGLMRLPGGKRLLAPDQGLFPAYTHGMFVKGKTRMLISEGLGGPRIMIRPQLALLTLSRDVEE